MVSCALIAVYDAKEVFSYFVIIFSTAAISFSPLEEADQEEMSNQAEFLHELNQMGYSITTTSELVL